MWLRDSLPADLPGVQVLLYGYDTRLLESHSFQGIEDIARRLRESTKNILSLQVCWAPNDVFSFICLLQSRLVGSAQDR